MYSSTYTGLKDGDVFIGFQDTLFTGWEGTTLQCIWSFPWPWGYPKLAGFCSGKSQSKVDDEWWYPYDLGNLHFYFDL